MTKKSTSLLLCFPTSSSTPSLAGAAGVTSGRSRSSLGSSVMSAIYFFFLLFANVVILCAGSIFLSWLEMPHEDELRRTIALKRAVFIETYLHNSSRLAKELDELLSLVQDSAQKGILTNFPDNNLHHNSAWSFGSAFLFLTTIATTVGYGHAAPQTKFGKAFSMIYGTIAIPLLLAYFGELIRKLVAMLNWIFMRSIGRRFRQQSLDGGSSLSPVGEAGNIKNNSLSSTSVRVKVVFVLFVSIMLIFSTILIPAFTFSALEPKWSFLDALYYCFISMTTVGLGDVIPGEGPEWNVEPHVKELYHISIALYLLTALPLFFLAIKLISSLVTTAETSWFRGAGDEEDDEIGDITSRQELGRTKPRIQVDDATDTEDDDYDNYDATSGLIGGKRQVIRADSDTQLTSDGDEETMTGPAADDDVVRGSGVNSVKQITTTIITPSSDVDTGGGSFAYLFPQPAPSNGDVKKSKQSTKK